jgi:hypothetical protein
MGFVGIETPVPEPSIVYPVPVVKCRFGVAAATSANRLRAKDGEINQGLGRLS